LFSKKITRQNILLILIKLFLLLKKSEKNNDQSNQINENENRIDIFQQEKVVSVDLNQSDVLKIKTILLLKNA